MSWDDVDKAIRDFFATERDGAVAVTWVLAVGGVDADSMKDDDASNPILFCTDGGSASWAQEGLALRLARELRSID